MNVGTNATPQRRGLNTVLSWFQDAVRGERATPDRLLREALDQAPNGLIVLDRLRAVHLLTRGAARMLGLRADPTPRAVSLSTLLASSDALDASALVRLGSFMDGAHGETNATTLSVTGSEGACLLSLDLRPLADLGWVLSIDDVTQTRQSHDLLLECVSTDTISGLWNRQHFLLMLGDRLDTANGDPENADPENGGLALLKIGLHRFRMAIETHGCDVGEALLGLVGARLRGFLRETDMAARTGAEEFSIVFGGHAPAETVAAMAERLVELLSRPYLVDGQEVLLGVNVGIARAPADATDARCLVAAAALALSAAEADAPCPPWFFDVRLDDQARRRRALEADLRCALERNEFELHFQPQVDVASFRVTGLEALIRWRNSVRGLVPPNDFIHIAERIGLIVPIGEWVLQEACREAMTWPDDIAVAVNASPLQFEAGGFAAAVARALAASGLEPNRLEVEITENLLLRESAAVVATLEALRDMGVRLVLDDFGTGFASLGQLNRFRFDKIKIDRSLLAAPNPKLRPGAIVRSIAALGIGLGIPTTAEGVETIGQLDQIRDDGCTSVQGYYFSKPVPADDVVATLQRLAVENVEILPV